MKLKHIGITVQPTIIDPDYTFLKVTANIIYDQKKTNLTANQIGNLVKTSISNYAENNLNTFNSTFSGSSLVNTIQNVILTLVPTQLP